MVVVVDIKRWIFMPHFFSPVKLDFYKSMHSTKASIHTIQNVSLIGDADETRITISPNGCSTEIRLTQVMFEHI